jgi:hypothetical protein
LNSLHQIKIFNFMKGYEMDTKCTHEDNKKTRNLVYQVFRDVKSDLDWIQTSNLLSRNEMRYSVAPRGLIEGANI